MLVDTHAHLFWDSFKEDLDQVVNRALDIGVSTIINVGTDLETSKQVLQQAETGFTKYPNLTVYSSIGIHPHEAVKYINNQLEEDIKKLEDIYQTNSKKVIAVGECGLDFNFSNPDFIPSSLTTDQIKDLQRKLLKAQVNLAKKLNLPLLIHTREAWSEIWDLISDHYGILHCFSGDLDVAKKALNSNFLVSFAATITYPKNETLREVAKFLPLEKIVLETDCPFLPPQSRRGERNEPAAVKEIAQLIADLRGSTLEEIASQITSNAKRVFKLT